MASLKVYAALVVNFVLRVCYADLPVHCLRHQVAGDWEFTLGPMGPKRSSCGHQNPDSAQVQPSLEFLESQGTTTLRRFSLRNPDLVSGEDGSTGTWTMIYDEGFEVAAGDFVYFAFSYYEFMGEPRTNVSRCGATQVGWYHNTARSKWGCYRGKKVVRSDSGESSDAPASHPMESQVKLSSISMETVFGKVFGSQESHFPESAGFDKPMQSDWQDSVVNKLNFLQLGWTAATYDGFADKTPRELNRLAGVRHSRITPLRSRRHTASQSSSPLLSSFLGLDSRSHRISGPDFFAFDWRNKDGKNWLEPVVDQGDCGSCYTISTVHMLTARNRINHGDVSEPSFSVSFPLYCSEYNQGCDGGYGFLQTKWSEDVGLVPESCMPFSKGGGACKIHAGCDLGSKRYRAAGHHYVGGFYGGSDEEHIRQELVSGGPVVMSFEPKEDFMYYKSGIYRSGPNKIHQEWEQVDHAVLLVGYGEDNFLPFWSLQNSWGSRWGEAGFFRMARGIDESGSESIVVSANVAVEGGNTVLDEFLASV